VGQSVRPLCPLVSLYSHRATLCFVFTAVPLNTTKEEEEEKKRVWILFSFQK
jgi:hypothetical protein